MPRRYVYKMAEIYKARGVSWARHYERRGFAVSCGLEPLKVLNALVRVKMPEPIMQIDGFLYRPHDVICAEHAALGELGLPWKYQDLMCVWYWTENNWMGFVRLYENLPDLEEDFYMVYDAERDGALYVPMSSKPKRGDVPKPVDKSVGKSRTSKVQVPVIMYKSAGE